MFPPLPKRDPDPDTNPLDERELNEEAYESLLEKNAEAYGLYTTQPIAIFWLLVSVALSVTGGFVGGVFYGFDGAIAGVTIAMSAVMGLMPIMMLGDALSRTFAGAAGAMVSLASVYRLGGMEPWLCQLAFFAGGGAALLAASGYREYLAREHGCPRLRFTVRGLMLRGVYVVLAAIAWANYSGGS